ncbi:type II toxin-antitoxin system prevent-host-death family antitoxin [Actinomadura sp. LD22]|uniref:Antitoxin n=1 Tax=Actinomadura physcomitrii TaxID=2650748 RepID=A0A6I4MNZ4_9ACTN|nr:type II toxin-antitoxin system Phd/YefM family antitoxin [Actinomadura physcomitrii]MWA06700.1 type II toxin-antitoxin system prevent-host-death family antitoxin [Actinomadura physcomitrii]
MNSVEKPVTEARKEFADLVNRVAYTGERVALTRRGKVMAALVSAEDLELLESLRAGRLDLAQTGTPAPTAPVQQPDRPRQAPLRIAAEYRPGGPPRPPGFGR